MEEAGVVWSCKDSFFGFRSPRMAAYDQSKSAE